jgi:hypothetical protein
MHTTVAACLVVLPRCFVVALLATAASHLLPLALLVLLPTYGA